MKKLFLFVFVLSLCCNDRIVYYEPAPIDDILTCCGKKDASNYHVIFSRVVTPRKTRHTHCTKQENLFYKITKTQDSINIDLVCKWNFLYFKMEEECGDDEQWNNSLEAQ
jgi:hypothetical protein